MTPVDFSPPIAVQVFADEFGAIDRSVYEAASLLWSRIENQSLRILRDAAAGQRLLMKACALVTRKQTETPDTIANLSAYLYQTWYRLALEEVEKQNLHHKIEETLFVETVGSNPTSHSADELDRRILLQQIIARMDAWTRRVFEYQTLGFTFDEIAAEMGSNGHAVRMRFDRQIKQLIKQLT